jgi:predicted kinase
MVSLDQIRREMGIAPTEPQTSVVKRAHSLARDLLRRQQSFVWNATHITRDVRSQSIRLCAENRARVHIVYIETSEDRLMQQNEKRDFPVPKHVMKRLISRWQVPDRTEAHRVDWISSPVP